MATEMVQIAVHEPGAMGKPLRLGQDIEMEMGAAPGGLRHLLPRGSQDPADEVPRCFVVEGVLRHPAREEVDIVEKVEELLAEGAVRSQEITLHRSVLLEHERGLGLDVRVIAGQVVGKDLAILKNGIDRLAQESRVATEMPHCLPVSRLKPTNDET